MTTKTKKKAVAKTNVAKPATLQIGDLEAGELFSESSHYVVTSVDAKNNAVNLMHLETNKEVTFSFPYLESVLHSADHYFQERTVGKEDKLWTQKQIDEAKTKGELTADSTVRVGDVRVEGIRTIFENIYGSQVFTVVYETQPKERTQKELTELREQQVADAEARIEKAKRAKKGMASALLEILAEVQENPVTKTISGTYRTLRGYKTQFASRDGKYQCIDVDVKEVHNVRPVNINTITELCINGVKYIVE